MDSSDSQSQKEYSIPKTYDALAEEPKWQAFWREKAIYAFDADDKNRKTFSIDTPPPYPSGEFHVGNALNWTYIDFVARYRRMRGDNVHFPQGWDCHGLPTEVKAEQMLKIRKNDLPPAQFIEVCRKITDEYIVKMKEDINRLGISIDWQLEYKTMDPSYYGLTQLSFVRLYKSGYMYRGEHPVNWCPRCETAIAEAEVVYIERQGNLHYMKFGESETIEIASTRPELLAACVAIAVHPDDTRYKSFAGKKVKVPVFGQTVPVIVDEEVDSEFGTGAVIVCTFGDKMDVKWQKKHKLPMIRAITENGRIAIEDPRFKGLRIEEARKKVVEELAREGNLLRTETITRNIGTCWRCKTPVEIISRPQWFMKTRDMTSQVVDWSNKLTWIPSFARQRLIDWAESLDWDWVVSRQRIFATPIPVWYCTNCGQVIVPDENKLPVDPRKDPAPVSKCPKCQSTKFQGEKDVFDTWMDSSITPAVHAGWPRNTELFARLFPADLQPNGLDIIRTWDYYLMVRSLAIFSKPPYKTLLINGMVRGTDGRMMHKSYGNYVESQEVLKKLGADAFRQWAASGGSTGYDIPFRWNEVEHGKKFLTKIWNIARFIIANSIVKRISLEPKDLSVIDYWLLGSLQKLVADVTGAFDNFQFSTALETIREFAWHSLADDYLEAVKHRLQPDATPGELENTVYCLRQALLTILKLLAPVCPHVTETIYNELDLSPRKTSIHLEPWPVPEKKFLDGKPMSEGRILLDIIASARRKKSEKGLSLKTQIQKILVSAEPGMGQLIRENEQIILRTIRAESLAVQELPHQGQKGNDRESDFTMEILP
ncbi:MAG TPA: valine--tRNA ligase [Candidatus Bathyarchaeia archaeon]|nr:valine--tRNA ligase [Candidatus Bathyarchaeia archaeon]